MWQPRHTCATLPRLRRRAEWTGAQWRVACGEHRLIAIARKRRLAENVHIAPACTAKKDCE
jgi:hypothetical protein